MLRQACPEHSRRAQPDRGVQLQKFFPFALSLAKGDHEWIALKEKPYNLCMLRADCFFPPVGRDTGLHSVVQRVFTPTPLKTRRSEVATDGAAVPGAGPTRGPASPEVIHLRVR